MDSSAEPPVARDDIGNLADELAKPAYRSRYVHKVQDGLPSDRRNIPAALIEALNRLELDELAAVSQVNRHLEAAGLNGGRLMQFPV
jgi:hypothetical protein